MTDSELSRAIGKAWAGLTDKPLEYVNALSIVVSELRRLQEVEQDAERAAHALYDLNGKYARLLSKHEKLEQDAARWREQAEANGGS